MRILLLKPISEVYYVIQPNLGLGYLATIIQDEGHEVEILDSGKENLSWDSFLDIVKRNFDIIGIQMFTHDMVSVKKHIQIIKEHSNSITMVGGPHISSLPFDTMKYLDELDYGFVGEAEKGMEKFIKLKERNADTLSTVPNLVWKNEKDIIVNPQDNYNDLDEIKFPSWELMPIGDYPLAPHGSFSKHKLVAPIIATRGCPYKCTFCGGKNITGIKLRHRSISNLTKEILFLYQSYGVREFQIVDDNFTLDKKFVIEFCHRFILLDLNLSFSLPNGIRLDTLDEEILKLMEKAGFYSFAVGIESGSDRILKLMKKRINVKTIKDKIDLIKKHTNISITGFFLMGYPTETEEEILETIKFAKQLKIDKASFMFVMPLPGTQLWEMYEDKNNVNWNDFFYYRIVKNFSHIPADRLKTLHKKAMKEFYLRPKIIIGLIKQIKLPNQVRLIYQRARNILK